MPFISYIDLVAA